MVIRPQLARSPPVRSSVQRPVGVSGSRTSELSAIGQYDSSKLNKPTARVGKDLAKGKVLRKPLRTPPKMSVRNQSDLSSGGVGVRQRPMLFARRASDDGMKKNTTLYRPPKRLPADLKTSKVEDYRVFNRASSTLTSSPKMRLKKKMSPETRKSPSPTFKITGNFFRGHSPSPRFPKASAAGSQTGNRENNNTSIKSQVKLTKVDNGRCGICGKKQSLNGHGICTSCVQHFRNRNVKIGTLEDFKAFTNNIAQNVKKIVAIEGNRQSAPSLQQKEDLLQTLRETIPKIIEKSGIKESDKPGLQRYMTDLVLTRQKASPDLTPRSSSFSYEENTAIEGGDKALVPVQVCADKAIAVAKPNSDIFMTNSDADEDDSPPALMGPCLNGVCALPPRPKQTPQQSEKVPLAIDFVPKENPSDLDNVGRNPPKDFTTLKKSKTFAQLLRSEPESSNTTKLNREGKKLRAIEFSANETSAPNKVFENRAKTEIGFSKSNANKEESSLRKRPARDKSSSVDPVHGEMSKTTKERPEKVNSSESNVENKGKRNAHPSRSITQNNMKRTKTTSQKIEKNDKGPHSKLKTSAAMKSDQVISSSNIKKTSGKRSRRSDDDDEEEEDADEGYDLSIYKKPRSLMTQFGESNIVLTSKAIRALEQQRKKHLRPTQRTQSAINPTKYCQTDQGKVVRKDPYLKYVSSVSPLSHDGDVIRPTAVRSASLTDANKKPSKISKGIYYEGFRSNARSNQDVYTTKMESAPGVKIDDSNTSYTEDQSRLETDVDNGNYAYSSSGNHIKSGDASHYNNDGLPYLSDDYTSSPEAKKSHSDVSAGSALRRDLALGSGENPTWRKSPHYFEGILGHVYQFAKDFTFQNPPKVPKESAFGGGPLNDNIYTGGFFSKNPFYNNENPQSSSSSVSTNIYFESDASGAESLNESSKSDIYTGDVFASTRCSNNNKPVVGQSASSVVTSLKEITVQEGSANDSSRPTPVNRRQRVRSVGASIEGAADLFSWGILSSMQCNVSNNSSNGFYPYESDFYMDNFCEEDMAGYDQNAQAESTSSDYTDYDPRLRAPVEPEPQPEPCRPFDFAKYESWGSPSTGVFFNQSGSSEYDGCTACIGAKTSAKNTTEESDIFYTNMFSFSSYSNQDNIYGAFGAKNVNNNYPNYEELYSSKNNSQEQERRRLMELERLRRLEEEVNSYTGFRPPQPVDLDACYGDRSSYPCDPSGGRMNSTFAAEPEPAPAYFDMSPCEARSVMPVAQTQPKQPARPLVMKLGAITVRNNVENDNHYAANINMDLKGGPGAHPVPFDDGVAAVTGPIVGAVGDTSWQNMDDSYNSIYSSDRSYSDTGTIMSNWRDGTCTVARENWRGEPKIMEASHKRERERASSVGPGQAIKPSFPKDKPRQVPASPYPSIQQRRR